MRREVLKVAAWCSLWVWLNSYATRSAVTNPSVIVIGRPDLANINVGTPSTEARFPMGGRHHPRRRG